MAQPLEPMPALSGEPIEGGEAYVYFSLSDPDFVYKRYKTPRTGQSAVRLREQNRFINSLKPSDRLRLTESVTWPLVLYGTERRIDGCKMQRVSKSFYFSATVGNVKKERISQLDYLIDTGWWTSPAVKAAQRPVVESVARVEICHEYLQTLRCIWDNGAFYGDISPKNLLWTLSPFPRAMFLEGDSIRIVADPDNEEIHTQGWFPNPALSDLTARDRSLGGLLVFRILREDLNAKPRLTDSYSGPLTSTLQAARELWQTGGQSQLDRLIQELHKLRSDKLISGALERALDRGYAIEVLRHRPTRPTANQSETIALALQQVSLETALRDVVSARKRYALRNRVPMAGYLFDFPEEAQVPVKTASDLRKLMADLDYEGAATSYLGAQDKFSIEPQLLRAIQHLLVQVESAQPRQTKLAGDDVEVVWTWPTHAAVNALVLSGLRGPEVVFREVIRSSSQTIRLVIRSNLASLIERVMLQWANETTDGRVITPSESWERIDQCRIVVKSRGGAQLFDQALVFSKRPATAPQPANYGFSVQKSRSAARLAFANSFKTSRFRQFIGVVRDFFRRKVFRRP